MSNNATAAMDELLDDALLAVAFVGMVALVMPQLAALIAPPAAAQAPNTPFSPEQEAQVAETFLDLAVDAGTATAMAAAGSSSLTDDSKSWAPGVHRSRLVRIVDGAGAGQARVIADNGSNTLTVATAWAAPLDATSAYVILGL